MFYKIDTWYLCDLQKLNAAKGNLQSELAAVKKKAKKDGEVAQRKWDALVAEKRELQVSLWSPCGAYAISAACGARLARSGDMLL